MKTRVHAARRSAAPPRLDEGPDDREVAAPARHVEAGGAVGPGPDDELVPARLYQHLCDFEVPTPAGSVQTGLTDGCFEGDELCWSVMDEDLDELLAPED